MIMKKEITLNPTNTSQNVRTPNFELLTLGGDRIEKIWTKRMLVFEGVAYMKKKREFFLWITPILLLFIYKLLQSL